MAAIDETAERGVVDQSASSGAAAEAVPGFEGVPRTEAELSKMKALELRELYRKVLGKGCSLRKAQMIEVLLKYLQAAGTNAEEE